MSGVRQDAPSVVSRLLPLSHREYLTPGLEGAVTKITLLSGVLAAGSAIAREPTGQMVTICLTTDRNPVWLRQPTVDRATMIADHILAGAGVRLSWRGNLDPCLGEALKAVQVDLSWNRPPGELPGAVGYAQPV